MVLGRPNTPMETSDVKVLRALSVKDGDAADKADEVLLADTKKTITNPSLSLWSAASGSSETSTCKENER